MALIEGEDFELSTTNSTQMRLDTDYVKDLIEELQLAGKITLEQKLACFKDIKIETIRTNRKDASKKLKFEPPNLTQMTPSGAVDLLGTVRERMANDKKEEGIYKEWLKTHFKKDAKTPEGEGGDLGLGDELAAKLDDDKPDWA